MGKAILISIKPKWVAKILNGEKTIEIRKTMPKCDLPIDVYIYCSKDNKNTLFYQFVNYGDDSEEYYDIAPLKDLIVENEEIFNGKVVAKFTLNKVDRYVNGCKVAKKYPTFNDFEKILTPACIYTDELENYCEDLSFYAWHISNLKIFDKPKELSEFRHSKQFMPSGYMIDPLTKAPQSWCYVEE